LVSTVHHPDELIPVCGLKEVTKRPKVGIVQSTAIKIATKLAQGELKWLFTASTLPFFIAFAITAPISHVADASRYRQLME
jgi:hypothetical protein